MQTLFDNGTIRVQTNGSGEIFLENLKDSRAMIRVGNDSDGLIIRSEHETLMPWSHRNMAAIRVAGGRPH